MNYTRTTSVYTLHVNTPLTRDYLRQLLPFLPPVQDVGEASVSWRSTGDTEALQEASGAVQEAGLAGTWATLVLTTGLGVHKREVKW